MTVLSRWKQNLSNILSNMCVLIAVTLSGLLAVCGATPLGCKELVTPLVREDVGPIMGRWIFMEGVADHKMFTTLLKQVNSSWMEFAPSALADTFTLSQGNMIAGKCQFPSVNTTITNSTFHAIKKNVTSEAQFLPSSHDCLTMSFTSETEGMTIQSLYIFSRSGKLKASELDMFWRQAQCLGHQKTSQFSYDGVTELCRETKDSSLDAEPEKDKHDQ